MEKFKVKWAKNLVGKKVYACSAPRSGWSGNEYGECARAVYEAEVKVVKGEKVQIQPLNFMVAGENGLHEVQPKEIWFTTPTSAVLNRIKSCYQGIADSIKDDRVMPVPSDDIHGRMKRGEMLKQKRTCLSDCLVEALGFAERMERFKSFPSDYAYKVVAQTLGQGMLGMVSHAYDLSPETQYQVTVSEKRVVVSNLKTIDTEVDVDVSPCFKSLPDGRLSVSPLDIFKYLKGNGALWTLTLSQDHLY